MAEEDSTSVEAVLNIVRMELDPSGVFWHWKKELDKSEANKVDSKKFKNLLPEMRRKTLKKTTKLLWLVCPRGRDQPRQPTWSNTLQGALELVESAQWGKTYKQHDIFTLVDPDHTEEI